MYYIVPTVIILTIAFCFLTRKSKTKIMRDELEPIKSALGFLK